MTLQDRQCSIYRGFKIGREFSVPIGPRMRPCIGLKLVFTPVAANYPITQAWLAGLYWAYWALLILTPLTVVSN